MDNKGEHLYCGSGVLSVGMSMVKSCEPNFSCIISCTHANKLSIYNTHFQISAQLASETEIIKQLGGFPRKKVKTYMHWQVAYCTLRCESLNAGVTRLRISFNHCTAICLNFGTLTQRPLLDPSLIAAIAINPTYLSLQSNLQPNPHTWVCTCPQFASNCFRTAPFWRHEKHIPLVPLETGVEVPGVGEESDDDELDSNIIDMVSSAIVRGVTFGKHVEEQ